MSVLQGWEIASVSAYFLVLAVLSIYGAHRSWLVWQYHRHRHSPMPDAPDISATDTPSVLVQLPLYNERYVAERLIRAVAALDYPADRLQIQVLDDSTDETRAIVARLVSQLQTHGVAIEHIRRPDRVGFKAGALAHGLERSREELVAIFDADFLPQADFLRQTVPHFTDPAVGMVQTRWEHINGDYSMLTRAQAVLLDGHFVIEHTARHRGGCFFNFNGTAGIWRREAIETSGGWQHDTVTEDLDLSYRAQLAGWRFIYRPQTATPSELPIDILDFKNQQHRWTKGAIQTARKLLQKIWRAAVPLKCKVEATFHLTSNFCYPLMVLLVILLGPTCLVRVRLDLPGLIWLDIPILLATTVSVGLFYLRGQLEIGRPVWRSLLMLPIVMALGIGMSINNTRGVIEGWRRKGGEFVRTPKYRIEKRADVCHGKRYTRRASCLTPVLEWLAFGWCSAIVGLCVWAGVWTLLPFLGLFAGGFGTVCLQPILGRTGLRPVLAEAQT